MGRQAVPSSRMICHLGLTGERMLSLLILVHFVMRATLAHGIYVTTTREDIVQRRPFAPTSYSCPVRWARRREPGQEPGTMLGTVGPTQTVKSITYPRLASPWQRAAWHPNPPSDRRRRSRCGHDRLKRGRKYQAPWGIPPKEYKGKQPIACKSAVPFLLGKCEARAKRFEGSQPPWQTLAGSWPVRERRRNIDIVRFGGVCAHRGANLMPGDAALCPPVMAPPSPGGDQAPV
jgi:hypothetical protein